MTALERPNDGLSFGSRTSEGSVRAAAVPLPLRLPRSRRVLVLIAGILALSLADLVITLTHLRTIGMVEANPIAAWLIRTTQSSWILSMFKISTVGVCVALLYRLRSRVQGEIAAWIALMILAGMSLIWHRYSQSLDDPNQVQLAQIQSGDRWLFLD